MRKTDKSNLDYDRPVKIAEDIYWVGFYDMESKLHCNPYLVVDGDEAVVIDSGSRPDFHTVMMKILRTGISPNNISALIYQHYDHDLCGNISNFEDIIDNDSLRIISDRRNNIFIRHYSVTSELVDLEDVGFTFEFSSGRKLEFTLTPYAHSAGSFVTFDSKTGVLFTSDLFGSYAVEWDLFLTLSDECERCRDYENCPHGRTFCPFPDILRFHRMIMTSEKALRLALRRIESIDCDVVAPQHGSVIVSPRDRQIIADRLMHLPGIGIDGLVEGD